MSQNAYQAGALVLYKSRPAVVTDVGEKITIQIEPKKAKRVRDKDIELLHSGPIANASELVAQPVDVEEAWELLDGESCSLADLSDLLFGDFTPETAWSSWVAVAEGVHFSGGPAEIATRSRDEIETDLEQIRLKQQEEEAKQRFFENIKNATLDDADRKRLSEVEMLALQTTDRSQILKQLDIKQTPESAHQFLVNCGYWDKEYNPFPKRVQVDLEQPDLPVPTLPDEDRLDLTHIKAWAIDDEGSEDPDDAISYHDGMLWVHVADVAALVPHDSELDLEARSRAANLYLPEGIIHMLPHGLTAELGLGLQEISPALSIGMQVDESAQISEVKVVATRIKVTRLTYADADTRLQELMPEVKTVCEAYRQKRRSNNAAEINLPEGSVRLVEGEVVIRPMDKLASRQMVTDAMLMAGEAVAGFCQQNSIPIPYATQPEPEKIQQPEKMSEMFAYRRQFKASRTSLQPEAHFGLGLEQYTRCTSPLRRYQDLTVHQQLRAFLMGETLLDETQLSEKLMSQDQRSGSIRRAERFSNQHWKLVYLQRNPQWQGQAVIVDKDERKAFIIIPELAMETKIRTRENFQLDDTISVRVTGVDLPEQTAYFQCL
ncbi:MAG: RNB domain-containing ribonuclease [Gammaproteobacteria bacterium]|nr:RNB domain-containing ribonuclease [Gammaproteobacteria bacterium]